MRLYTIYWILLSTQLADIQTNNVLDGDLVPFFEFKKKTRNAKKLRTKLSDHSAFEQEILLEKPKKALWVNPRGNRFGANVIKLFETIDSIQENEETFQYKFNVNLLEDEILEGAQLIIQTNIKENQTDYVYQRITISEIIKKTQFDPITNILDTKLINLYKNATISFDVETAIRRWTKNRTKKISQNLLITTSKPNLIEFSTPFLLIYLTVKTTPPKPLNKNRFKRRQIDRLCRRHKMYVDFEDLGWSDWIIAPSGYHAYFCSGDCDLPYPEHVNVTNHAVVQTMAHLIDPENVPKPCCVPTKLNSISLLTVEGDGVVIKEYSDMVVASCGCQ